MGALTFMVILESIFHVAKYSKTLMVQKRPSQFNFPDLVVIRMKSPVQLKIVELALTKFPDNGHDSITAIISDFLVSDIPLSKAIELSHPGSVALLDLVWTRSLRDMEHSRWTVAKLLQSEKDYYKWEFSLALVQAIRRSDVKMVQWILTHFSNCRVGNEVVEEAAEGGHLWVLQLLDSDHSHGGIEWKMKCLDTAGKRGHWDVVRWLDQRINDHLASSESRTEDYDEDGYYRELANCAFYQCNLEQYKWALANYFELSNYLSVDQWDLSERQDRWEVVRYALSDYHGNNLELLNRAAEAAVTVGDLEFIKWLAAYPRPFQFDDAPQIDHNRVELEKPFAAALEAAGRYGRVPILEYLLLHLENEELPHDLWMVMFQAAKHGKLEVVKWLVNRYTDNLTVNLLEMNDDDQCYKSSSSPNTAMDVAAGHGHLEILQFLHQVNVSQRHKRKRNDRDTYPTDDKYRRCTNVAMDLAAANGHLEVVKWLHENRNEGCTAFAMSSAAENGHLEVVKWLHANRSEGCWYNVLDGVISRYFRLSSCCANRLLPRKFYEPNLLVQNQLPIVQWLHSNGYEGCTAAAMDGAAANGNFELIKWLHQNTTIGCTYRAMDSAAEIGRLDIVQWFHEQLLYGRVSTAMEYAAAGGHLDILKWLYAKHSIPCSAQALDVAVHGNLTILQAMLEHESTEYVSEVKEHGHLEVVKWILAHGEDLNIKSAMERAIVCKEPEIVFFLDGYRTDRDESVEEMRMRLRNQSLLDIGDPLR